MTDVPMKPNTEPTQRRRAARVAFEDTDAGGQRRLVLVKDGQRYVFQCPLGHEPDLLRQFAELVRDPNVDLDWFDAAVLSHRIGERLGQQLQQMRKTA